VRAAACGGMGVSGFHLYARACIMEQSETHICRHGLGVYVQHALAGGTSEAGQALASRRGATVRMFGRSHAVSTLSSSTFGQKSTPFGVDPWRAWSGRPVRPAPRPGLGGGVLGGSSPARARWCRLLVVRGATSPAVARWCRLLVVRGATTPGVVGWCMLLVVRGATTLAVARWCRMLLVVRGAMRNGNGSWHLAGGGAARQIDLNS
jgi:hypothetical protein